MVNREFQALANDFEDLGLLPPGSDKDSVVPALTAVFERALAGGVQNMSFGTLSGDLGKTMYPLALLSPSYGSQYPYFEMLLFLALEGQRGASMEQVPLNTSRPSEKCLC